MSREAFSKTSVIWITSLLGISFVGGLLLMVFDDVFAPASVDADSSSTSAIGHHSLAATFENYGWTVIRSSANTLDQVIDGDVLIVAEPVLPLDDDERWEKLSVLMSDAYIRLLVLPKRHGTPDDDQPRWLTWSGLVPEDQCERVLEAAGISGDVIRLSKFVPLDEEDEPSQLDFIVNYYGVNPSIEALQLMRSPQLEPLIEAAEGILLGEVRHQEGKFYVLSDPDLLSNHGLGDGDNLELVHQILADLRDGDSALVFDESLHAIAAPESIWQEMMRFPLVLVTFSALLLMLVALWNSMGRFGQPEPLKRVLALGKSYLIDNTARLLAMGGHSHHILRRYQQQSIEVVWQVLRPGQAPDKDQQTETLGQIEDARQTTDQLAELVRLVANQKNKKALGTEGRNLAIRLYRWRREMIDGTGINTNRS